MAERTCRMKCAEFPPRDEKGHARYAAHQNLLPPHPRHPRPGKGLLSRGLDLFRTCGYWRHYFEGQTLAFLREVPGRVGELIDYVVKFRNVGPGSQRNAEC